MPAKTITIFFIFIFVSAIGINAQTIENWIEQNEKLPVEKIYLHTDREFYFSGETIWFKSYLTDSRSGQLIPGAENVYVNLVTEDGDIALEKILMSVKGQAAGSIALSDTLPAGGYMLQVFTDYLLNFGENAFFQKAVRIEQPPRSEYSVERSRRAADQRKMVAGVSFFPEGGMLLENTSNLVAFKAIDEDGYGVEAKGSVTDQSGETVATFQTSYNGMGLFFLQPETDKSYKAEINGFPSFRFSFDSLTVSQGIKIQLVNQTSKKVIINITSNSEEYFGETFYLANMYRGEVLFYQPFEVEKNDQVLKFDSKNFKGGINRIVLLDKNLKPVSERLLFSKKYELNELEVQTNAGSYQKRSEVQIDLKDKSGMNSNLSLAVVNQNALPEKGKSQTILSVFLIDSELNGFNGPSADFFTSNHLPSETKLRLLMLTHGWRKYFWNTAPSGNQPLRYQQKTGLDLKGTAKNIVSEEPLKNGEITLIIEKDSEMAFLTRETNDSGEFIFPGLLFNDTARVFVQAKNERGRQNTSISLKSALLSQTPSDKNLGKSRGFKSIPAGLMENKYSSELAFRRHDPFAYRRSGANRNSDEEEGSTADNYFRIYENADHVVEVPNRETSYSNILEYLTGKVAGVDVSNDNVRIRGASNFEGNSTPLFLIDGVPLSSPGQINFPDAFNPDDGEVRGEQNRQPGESVLEAVRAIPLRDIDKVEILKSPQKLAAFGTEGANGVIAIYTRRGEQNIGSPVARGMIKRKIAGYATALEFFSPQYTPENRDMETSDFRTTLFWDPELSTGNGTASRSFFTSDQTGVYKIIVEGITDDGTISLGNAEFEVK